LGFALGLLTCLQLAACGDDGGAQPDAAVKQDRGPAADGGVDAPVAKPDGAVDTAKVPDLPVSPDGPPPLQLTWKPMTSGTTKALRAVWGSGPTDVFAVGASGTVLHFNGSSWTPMTAPNTWVFYAVTGNGPKEVVAAGYGGVVNTYDGSKWSDLPTGMTKDINGIWSPGPKSYYVACDSGMIYHYDGATWKDVSPSLGYTTFNGVAGTSSSDIWIVGSKGTIAHFNGKGWNQVTSNTTGEFYAAYAAGPKAVYATGLGGLLAANLGSGWVHMSAYGLHHYAVHGSGPGNVFVVGYKGSILHYNGHGYKWTQQTSGSKEYLRGVWVAGPKEVFVVGDNGTILHGTAP
jgi:photosystem II stability/assembly factor-like uncharacterized protein